MVVKGQIYVRLFINDFMAKKKQHCFLGNSTSFDEPDL